MIRHTGEPMELEITSDHPWYAAVCKAASVLFDLDRIPISPNILASLKIGGVEEFFVLDHISEITYFDPSGPVIKTRWHRVRYRP